MNRRFLCNVCGSVQDSAREALVRETSSCPCCGSSVRWRSVIHGTSMALFGRSIPLPGFPSRPNLRGMGLCVWEGCAVRLADRLDFRNAFGDRPPRLDIGKPPRHLAGRLDLLVASGVAGSDGSQYERLFRGAATLLKPGGHLVWTTAPWEDGVMPEPAVGHCGAAGFEPVISLGNDVPEFGIFVPEGHPQAMIARKTGQDGGAAQ